MPRTHHLHIYDLSYEDGRRNWDRQILFRDYLLANPDEAKAYETLKRNLAAQFTHGRIAYGDHKTDFILATLEKAQAWREIQPTA